MKKKYGIILCVLLFIVCGLIWWFMPVHFLSEVEPEEVATIIDLMGIMAMNLKLSTQTTFPIL